MKERERGKKHNCMRINKEGEIIEREIDCFGDGCVTCDHPTA